MNDEAKRAVIRVGEARGFVVEGGEDRFVITAAHCLPYFPPCFTQSGLEGRTYESLIGPLGREPTVWAECLFVDAIGDIAVLGPPDIHGEAYQALIEDVVPLPIKEAPPEGPAWLLSLGEVGSRAK